MAESGTPKCGSCTTPEAGAADSATPDTCPDPTVPATDPCVPQNPCEETVSPCEEDHTNTVIEKKFSAVVKVTNTFNFPAVGELASLTLDGVESLLPGSILWNRTVGRLYVESYDYATKTAVVTNKGDSCDTTAKSAGDSVPACTEFAVGIPECNTGTGGGNSDLFPFLSADFVAPANGACQLASVTNVNGINVNDIVSINTFQYRVQSIPDANTLELCNEGQGAPTGQVIEWDPNCDETPDVQVISVSSDDPCSREGVPAGVIVVCDDNVRKPLVGTADSQIPVWNNSTEQFELQIVSLPVSCTFLTACLITNIGDDGPYIAEVEDSSLFVIGNVVEIDGDAFTVDTIPDGTHLGLIPVVTPTAITKYVEGETVCIQDCCVTLPGRVTEIENTLNDPCFQKGLWDSFYSTFASQSLTFQPTDLGGGQYQQHYDIGDPALPAEFYNFTVPLPDDGCPYFVEAIAYMHIGMNAQGPDPAIPNIRQLHDFVLAVNGDTTSLEPRMVASHTGSGLANDFVDGGGGGDPAPAGFLTNPYPLLVNRESLSTYREVTVNVAGTDPDPQFQIGHRLSFSDNIDAPNWGDPLNRIEWALNGAVIVRAYKLITGI